MQVDDAIRERRTLKAFTDETVDEATVRELLALAVHAPNHHRTEPWRFTVLGPETIERLAEATGDPKLRRSRTAVVVDAGRRPGPGHGAGGLRGLRLRHLRAAPRRPRAGPGLVLAHAQGPP